MITLLQTHLNEIKSLCKENGVLELFLFGSATSNSINENSDLDFAVTFKNELSPIERGEAFLVLLEALEILLERKIDLISYKVIKNPVFKEEVDNTKICLYAAA